jgi:hypothetical protein
MVAHVSSIVVAIVVWVFINASWGISWSGQCKGRKGSAEDQYNLL